jgi:hypothetical protein
MTCYIPAMELLSDKASRLVRATLAQLRPPPEIPLAEWIESHVQLPEGLSAMPGRMKLWPYQEPHAPENAGAITFAPGTTLPSTDEARDPVPVASSRR